MVLTNDHLQKILELSSKAIRGPWKFDHGNHNVEWCEDRMVNLFYGGNDWYSSPQDDMNLEYIAELSPEVVRKMILEIIAWRVNRVPG